MILCMWKRRERERKLLRKVSCWLCSWLGKRVDMSAVKGGVQCSAVEVKVKVQCNRKESESAAAVGVSRSRKKRRWSLILAVTATTRPFSHPKQYKSDTKLEFFFLAMHQYVHESHNFISYPSSSTLYPCNSLDRWVVVLDKRSFTSLLHFHSVQTSQREHFSHATHTTHYNLFYSRYISHIFHFC